MREMDRDRKRESCRSAFKESLAEPSEYFMRCA